MFIHPRRLEIKVASALRDALPDVEVKVIRKKQGLYHVYVISDYYDSKDTITNTQHISSLLSDNFVDYKCYDMAFFPFFIKDYYDKRSST